MSDRTRALHPDDLLQVAELENAVQLDPWTRAQVLEIAPMIQTGEYLGAVVEQTGQVQGYVIARTMLDECEILSVGVAHASQGQGLGKQVLQQLFSQFPAQTSTVHLEVRVSNLPALKLYEALGFIEVGRRKGYYAPTNSVPHREDARLMCKQRRNNQPTETTP